VTEIPLHSYSFLILMFCLVSGAFPSYMRYRTQHGSGARVLFLASARAQRACTEVEGRVTSPNAPKTRPKFMTKMHIVTVLSWIPKSMHSAMSSNSTTYSASSLMRPLLKSVGKSQASQDPGRRTYDAEIWYQHVGAYDHLSGERQSGRAQHTACSGELRYAASSQHTACSDEAARARLSAEARAAPPPRKRRSQHGRWDRELRRTHRDSRVEQEDISADEDREERLREVEDHREHEHLPCITTLLNKNRHAIGESQSKHARPNLRAPPASAFPRRPGTLLGRSAGTHRPDLPKQDGVREDEGVEALRGAAAWRAVSISILNIS
jgi:hypothetical protein